MCIKNKYYYEYYYDYEYYYEYEYYYDYEYYYEYSIGKVSKSLAHDIDVDIDTCSICL